MADRRFHADGFNPAGLVLVIRKPESGRKEMATEEVIRTVRRHDPLAGARARLNGRRAFDFSEISMPSPSHLRG